MHLIAISKIVAKVGYVPIQQPYLRLIMKLQVILLLFSGLTVSANSLAQKVTLEGKSLSIEKVIQTIEKQTGYVFFYDYAMLEKAKPVSISIQKAPLLTALREGFKGQPFSYEVVGKTIVVKLRDNNLKSATVNKELAIKEVGEQQQIEIKGTVTGENNESLPAVS